MARVALIGENDKPELTETIAHLKALDVAPSTPEAFSAYVKSEIAKWAKVIKASGMKPE